MSLQPSPLRAGAAQVDITPWAGVQLSGAVGTLRSAQLVADPLHAKVLIFESNGRKLCFAALDLTIITKPYTDLIRKAAVEKFGFDPDAVMVHVTQTHSAPGLGHFMVDQDFEGIPPELDWLRGGDESYNTFVVEQTVEAIEQADAALQPVQIGAASGVEGRMAFNRRGVKRDGTVIMPHRCWEGRPLGPTEILYLEGPMDPELGVLAVRANSLQVLALLVNYTCHPVHVFPKLIVSADWPGALSDELRSTYGAKCVPLVLNGACGNINPWPPFEPDYEYNGDHRQMGGVLAATARKVVESLTFHKEAVLDWRVKHLKLPIRQVDPQQLEADHKLLEEYPEPPWADETRTQVRMDWIFAASRMSVHLLRQREAALDYEIQVLRVGDTAFVGLPGEPFAEGGLRIKQNSPAYPTYIVHCTTQYVGYLPTREALPHGGHEVNTTYWAKLVPEALDMVVDGATELLHDVFGA